MTSLNPRASISTLQTWRLSRSGRRGAGTSDRNRQNAQAEWASIGDCRCADNIRQESVRTGDRNVRGSPIRP